MSGELVLVTGGSGYVGSHTIVQLLNAGYRVRTSVRSLNREAEVRAMLKTGGVVSDANLAFIQADLTSDTNWRDAVADCSYVLHVASPFSLAAGQRVEDLIGPARDGTLRVLRASRDAGVKRVVLTSSFVAVGYGHAPTTQPFTETSWTDPTHSDVNPYMKSKTIAERAAWDFIEREGNGLELSVMNPTGIFGPVLGPDYSDVVQIVRRLLDGELPAVPRMAFGVVDVRDLADLHLRAMVNPAANHERFIAVADGSPSLQDIALVLKKRLGTAANCVPSRELPDWVVRLAGLVNPEMQSIARELGQVRQASNEKAKRLLGWTPRPYEETIVDTAESMLRLGLVGQDKKAA